MSTDLDSPERDHNLTLFVVAILSWFIENKSRFLNHFTIDTYQVKFNYNISLRTSYITYGNSKGVSYDGTDIVLVCLQKVLITCNRYRYDSMWEIM